MNFMHDPMMTRLRLLGLSLLILLLPTSSFGQNLLDEPESVVFDSQYNRYLVSNWGDGRIIAIDSLQVMSEFNTDLAHVAGLHIVDDVLYAASNYGPHAGLVGLDLASGDMILELAIGGMQLLNDITSDNAGYLYITEYFGNKIYKVRISDSAYWTFVDNCPPMPNGILFDEQENRLLVMLEGAGGAPIAGVGLEDSTLTTLVLTGLASTDGLTEDNAGNIYVSFWATNSVYRYVHDFSEPRELVSSGHNGPADIFFNKLSNILAVPNFNRNTVDFIPIDATAIEDPGTTGEFPGFDLIQNYPNPFNPRTMISFDLAEPGSVTLQIFDLAGRLVDTLVNSKLAGGRHGITWQGQDVAGRPVGSGVYFCRLKTSECTQTRRMTLVR